MQNNENDNTWKSDRDWKSRYVQLYSRRLFQPKQEPTHRISFMSNDATPYASHVMRMRALRESNAAAAENEGRDGQSTSEMKTVLSQRSELYDSYMDSVGSNASSRNETLLLDMVREQIKSREEVLNKPLLIPEDDDISDQSSETCMHGYSLRMTDRSVSRSRASRMSTRRDMDISSILAFQTSAPPAPRTLKIPTFQKLYNRQDPDKPKWSIRRAACPVCSMKWKDKSSIKNVKYSGLKRNSTADLPSVIAPARLRAQITRDYVPKPSVVTIDEGTNIHTALRNTSATWQLTRARRFRSPKLKMMPPEATAPPPITAPLARRDLDCRVNRFLKDEGMPN